MGVAPPLPGNSVSVLIAGLLSDRHDKSAIFPISKSKSADAPDTLPAGSKRTLAASAAEPAVSLGCPRQFGRPGMKHLGRSSATGEKQQVLHRPSSQNASAAISHTLRWLKVANSELECLSVSTLQKLSASILRRLSAA